MSPKLLQHTSVYNIPKHVRWCMDAGPEGRRPLTGFAIASDSAPAQLTMRCAISSCTTSCLLSGTAKLYEGPWACRSGQLRAHTQCPFLTNS